MGDATYAASQMRAARQAANAGDTTQARRILDHAIAETINKADLTVLRRLRDQLH